MKTSKKEIPKIRKSILATLKTQNSKLIFNDNPFLKTFSMMGPQESEKVIPQGTEEFELEWGNIPLEYTDISFFDVDKQVENNVVKSLSYTKWNNELIETTEEVTESSLNIII